jgi:hypothetical protein
VPPVPGHPARHRPAGAGRDAVRPYAAGRRTRRRRGCCRRAACADPAWGPAGAAERWPCRHRRRAGPHPPAGARTDPDGRRAAARRTGRNGSGSARPGSAPVLPGSTASASRAPRAPRAGRRGSEPKAPRAACRASVGGRRGRVADPGADRSPRGAGRRAARWPEPRKQRARDASAALPDGRRARACRPRAGAGRDRTDHRDGDGCRRDDARNRCRLHRPWIPAACAPRAPRRWRRGTSHTPPGLATC